MNEYPILFNAPMVRALLAGTKTQTRRVVKPQPERNETGALMWSTGGRRLTHFGVDGLDVPPGVLTRCPYGKPGDRLWVRETHMNWWKLEEANPDGPRLFSHVAAFDADGYELEPGERWIPSIHMLRAASRIVLEVTEVRVERLQDISEADCVAEGMKPSQPDDDDARHKYSPKWAYEILWDQLGGDWAANPWVCAVSFRTLP